MHVGEEMHLEVTDAFVDVVARCDQRGHNDERTRARHRDTSERIPHIKIGKYVRFDRQALRSFLERCRTT